MYGIPMNAPVDEELTGKGFDLSVGAGTGGSPKDDAYYTEDPSSDLVLDTGETQITSGLPTALVVAGAVGVAALAAWWWYR